MHRVGCNKLIICGLQYKYCMLSPVGGPMSGYLDITQHIHYVNIHGNTSNNNNNTATRLMTVLSSIMCVGLCACVYTQPMSVHS